MRKKYSYLVPVKKVNNNNKSEDIIIKNKNKEKKLNLFSNIFENEHKIYLEKYNKRFNKFLRLQTESKNMKILKKRIHEKRFKRYNSLFLDFFDIWNDCKINLTQNSYNRNVKNINEIYSTDGGGCEKEINNKKIYFENLDFNIKERYHDLYYDENEIFNTNYDEFIENRINDIKKNKIKNYTTNVESSFNDSNDKKIEMKLESFKINFYELKYERDEKNNKFFIYLPLSFSFLFYYKDIDFLKKS